MRGFIAAALFFTAPALSGCFTPTAPSQPQLCTTQPRWYCSPDGTRCWQEVDTYLAPTCPRVPIP